MKRQSWCCKFKQLVNCNIGSLEPVFLDAGLIFYFTFYLLGGGCVRTHRTPLLPTGLQEVSPRENAAEFGCGDWQK